MRSPRASGRRGRRGPAATDADGLARFTSFPVPSYRDINVSNAFEGYTASQVLHNVSASTSRTVDVVLSGEIIPPNAPNLWRATWDELNRSVLLEWQASSKDGGAPIKSYTATASPGGNQCSSAKLSCEIEGLESGPVNVAVTASNVSGISSPSQPLGAYMPDKPLPPTSVTATAVDRKVLVSWAPPGFNGGLPVTRYDVSIYNSTNAERLTYCWTSGALSCTVRDDLPYGEYTATVQATNALGIGKPSDPVPFQIAGPAPTATLISPASPTAYDTLSFRYSPSGTSTGATPSDFTLVGTATGCTVASVNGYQVSVTGCSEGTVSLTLKAGSLHGTYGSGPADDITSSPVVIDRTVPSTPVVTATLRMGASVWGNTIPITVTWTPSSDAGSGLAAQPYELWSIHAGTQMNYIGTYSGTTAYVSRTTTKMDPWSTEYVVYAIDKAGNRSSFGSSQSVSPILAQQSGARLYRGAWSTAHANSYSGGSAKSAKVAGSSATYDESGRVFGLIATKGPAMGKVKIYVNGAYQATVDLHARATQYRSIVCQKSWSTQKVRTVKLVVAGTRGRPRVDLDAFVELW